MEFCQAAHAAPDPVRLWLPRPQSLLLYAPQPLLIARELPLQAPPRSPSRPAGRRALPLAHRVRLLPPRLDLDAFQQVPLASPPPTPTAPPRARTPGAGTTLPEPLSERERELLQALARGHSNRELAELLGISAGTVRWHLSNIYGKLGVQRRTQAIARAQALELIDALPSGT